MSKVGEIVTISAESTNANDASLAVNCVVNAYIEHHNRQHQSTATEVLKILKKEKDGYADQVKQLSADMLKFRRENGAVAVDGEKGNVVLQKLSELSDVVTKAHLQATDAKLVMQSADAVASNPAAFRRLIDSLHDHPLEPPSQGPADSRWLDLQLMEKKLSRMRESFGPKHPTMQQMEADVTDLRELLEDMPRGGRGASGSMDKKSIDGWLLTLHETSDRLSRRETVYAQEYADQQKAAVEMNAKAAEYQQLESSLHRAEKVLDTLTARMQEVGVNGNTEAIKGITVLEVAKANPVPVRPARPKTFGLALVIGLMLGVGGAMLMDWMDQRVRSAEEAAALLGLPVLGVVPHIIGRLTSTERGREIFLQPRSDVSEAYRTVRTAVHFGSSDGKSKIILITSPSPGDGKSTMTSNLALAIAQANRRVLLIDADCRKPMQHRIFELEAGKGLSTYMAGHASFEEAIFPNVVPNLDILPCGPLPPNPAELLGSKQFLELLAMASDKYDQVIIDSPPVVPVTDARILAATADVTILVLRAEKSTRRMSEFAREALATVGANVLGVVVNDVPRRRSGYGYYYYGSYSYGSGSANGAKAASLNGGPTNGVTTNGVTTLRALKVDSDA